MMTCPYPFTRILIPYDASPAAQKALEWTAHLAAGGGQDVEQITLLRVIGGSYLARHVHNVDLRVNRLDQVSAWRRMRQRHVDEVILPLLEQGQRLLREKGVTAPIGTQVAEGKISEEITRLAGEGGYTTIVMGQRGMSPVKGLLLGSVTRQVLSLCQKITVFVVGQEAVFNPDCPISPLLLPVDGSEASLLAVRQGAALATRWKHCKPNLTLLHALDFVRVSASLNAGTPFLVKESEGILAAGGEILRDAGLEGFFTDQLQVGDPARLITEEAQAGHYALVLMGARGLSSLKQLLLGGVSSDVLHRVSQAVVGIVYLQAGGITGDNIGEEG